MSYPHTAHTARRACRDHEWDLDQIMLLFGPAIGLVFGFLLGASMIGFAWWLL